MWELEQYGRDSYGDPDYVSVYGLRPKEWYARGVRLLARTVVECTRDRLADLIGGDIAAVAAPFPGEGRVIAIDPFAGSANTLYWVSRRIGARAAVGFELDDSVFAATQRNLEIAGPSVTLIHERYETGLGTVPVAENDLVIVYVAPPWGDALSRATGLDLRRTSPPIAEIIDLVGAIFRRNKLLVAVQLYETVVADSLEAVRSRGDWATSMTYDIDPPGQNHGLLLMTLGWVP